ncbi:MAG TPA: hypothetical protein VK841_11765, partial [Polyangiaceae bacterium]|nr:hypothetical protein [Polyangiaceae bacterium]
GLAGIATGALATYWGRQDNTALQTTCSPHCSQASISHIQTMYLVADGAFGAGAAALAITTLFFAFSHTETSQPTQTTTMIGVRPTPSGAVASVSGTF